MQYQSKMITTITIIVLLAIIWGIIKFYTLIKQIEKTAHYCSCKQQEDQKSILWAETHYTYTIKFMSGKELTTYYTNNLDFRTGDLVFKDSTNTFHSYYGEYHITNNLKDQIEF